MRKTGIFAAALIFLFPICAARAQVSATLSIPDAVGSPDSSIAVPIRVSTDSTIGLAQFVIEYDGSVLAFDRAEVGAGAAGFSVSLVNPNLPFEPSAPGTDTNVLIQISGGGSASFSGQEVEVAVMHFKTRSALGKSPLAFDRGTNRTFLTTVNLQDLSGSALQFQDGSVEIQQHAPVVLWFPQRVFGAAGKRVTVPITVSTDSSIGLAQIVVEYDSTVIQFRTARPGFDAQGFSVTLTNTRLPFLPANPHANRNVLIQLSSGGSGAFSGENLQILEMDFDVTGAPGESSPLAFDPGSNRTFFSTMNLRDIAGSDIIFRPGGFHVTRGFVITNTLDDGDGSFRQALALANQQQGPDTLLFQIPKSDPGFDTATGTWTIQPASPLPAVTDDGLYIDGSSQSSFIGVDSNPDGPEIQLSGTGATSFSGLTVRAAGAEIYALIVNGFGDAGVRFESAGGGRIDDCIIGMNPAGTDTLPNTYGVFLAAGSQNIVIGDTLDTGNVIAGNRMAGIVLEAATENIVAGNDIGLGRTPDIRPGNGENGILLSQNSRYNLILGNRIGANGYGVHLDQASFNDIRRNAIGTSEQWDADFGNRFCGIFLQNGSSNNRIQKNVIGYNGENGIYVTGAASTGNSLSENQISRHSGAGIRIADGGNEELPPPVITEISSQQVRGTAGAHYEVQIYADEEDEGRVYIGGTVADSQGNFVVALVNPLPPLPYLTAIAIDQTGNTSAFSQPFTVTEVEEPGGPALPSAYILEQNFPNPFNPSTEIRFAVPQRCDVEIDIRNLLGQPVRKLLHRVVAPGRHRLIWDGKDGRGRQAPAGVYFIWMKSGSFVAIKKAILMR